MSLMLISRHEPYPLLLEKYVVSYRVILSIPEDSLAKNYEDVNDLYIELRVPKSEYNDEQVQEIIRWSRLPARDPHYYRGIAIHLVVMGGFERSIVFSHGRISCEISGRTEADFETIKIFVSQKEDRYEGVAFGTDFETTYAKSLEMLKPKPIEPKPTEEEVVIVEHEEKFAMASLMGLGMNSSTTGNEGNLIALIKEYGGTVKTNEERKLSKATFPANNEGFIHLKDSTIFYLDIRGDKIYHATRAAFHGYLTDTEREKEKKLIEKFSIGELKPRRVPRKNSEWRDLETGEGFDYVVDEDHFRELMIYFKRAGNGDTIAADVKGLNLIANMERNLETINHANGKIINIPKTETDVGYGHDFEQNPLNYLPETMSAEEALELLKTDLRKSEYKIVVDIEAQFTQDQFNALASLRYNIGSLGVIDGLLDYLNGGLYEKEVMRDMIRKYYDTRIEISPSNEKYRDGWYNRIEWFLDTFFDGEYGEMPIDAIKGTVKY